MTPEDLSFLDILRRLVTTRVAPLAAKTDEAATFVHRQLAVLAEAGMLGANLPEPFGPGIQAAALFAAVEVIAGACGSTASALTAHYLATDALLLGASQALQGRFLPAAAEGTKLGAFALTERNAGSDHADMRTRALREGDAYRIKGAKFFISNGEVADFIVVYDITDPAAGHLGLSAFVVENGAPGLTVGRVERTMGLRGGHVRELEFDCLIPEANRLGPEGTGFKTAMKVLDNGRLKVAAMATGIADTALTLAKVWCKTRIIGGEPLAKRQGILWQLADMAVDLAAARALAAQAVALRETSTRFTLQASITSFMPRKWWPVSPTPRCNCTAVMALPATFPLNVSSATQGFSASTKGVRKFSA